MPTYLDRILAAHRRMLGEDRRDVAALADAAASTGASRPARGFRAALAEASGRGQLGVIAEIKRRSPSRGGLAEDLDAAAVAGDYAAGGAACLSVLTDREFFGGSPDDLVAVRSAVGLPVLRKDFTVGLADVYDSRIMGADAVLLIAAALPDDVELRTLAAAAAAVGLDALVEVHDETELARALDAGATLIGVNQRDLVTFEVDTSRAERLAGAIPPGVLAVAESGVARPGRRGAPGRGRLSGGAGR